MYRASVEERVVTKTLHNMAAIIRSMTFINDGKDSGTRTVSIAVADIRIVIEDCWLRAKSGSLIAAKQEKSRRCKKWRVGDWQRSLLARARGVTGVEAIPG
jgi:hypothetical protein